jgi:preprotein translocase subunit SecD
MERRWWTRSVVLLFFILLAVAYVIPTVGRLDVEQTRFPVKEKINLGLDLQGGLYMVLGVDFEQVFQEVLNRQGRSLQDHLKERGLGVQSLQPVPDAGNADDPRFNLNFEPQDRDAIYARYRDQFVNTLRLTQEREGVFQFGISNTYRAEVRENTLEQSIEVIRNRVDEFGVAEPSITSQGTDRVVVELPGIRDVERAKALIGQTARLEFRIVDEETISQRELINLIAQAEEEHGLSFRVGDRFSEYVQELNKVLAEALPEGRNISFERVVNEFGETMSRQPYLLHTEVGLSGEELQDAFVQSDPESRQYQVAFSLTPRGASVFDRLTANNVNRRMAIVLDNVVVSAPNIQTRISGGSGVITLGRGNMQAQLREASDLAIVLRAGALPAQLEFMEQRVVGPSLGADSIRAGSLAALVGALFVLAFIAFYYRVSGLIACLLLVINITFVLAILVGLEATLTLPGIAGIALTIGIAVDSNVIIFERIREEIAAGKSLGGAVEAGFQKAFSALFDANITTGLAAIVLFLFGTGPIKGFAVTLMIGIVTTLFTALFAGRLFFEIYLTWLEKRRAKAVSI